MSDSSWIKEIIEPQKPRDIPLRPLSKGMRRDIPSNFLSLGEFYSLGNYMVRTDGLQRRNAMTDYLSRAAVIHPPVKLLNSIWNLNGSLVSTAIDSGALYYFGISSFNMVLWEYTTSTVTCDRPGGAGTPTRATGAAGTNWTTAANDLKVGDIFYCANLSGPRKWGIIDRINSATELYLTTDEGTCAAGASYSIRRAINPLAGKFPDAIALNGTLIIVDGKRRVRGYVPSSAMATYGYYSASAVFDDVWPGCVCFFKDRLFFGRIVETSGTLDERQRIRWTTALSLTALPALQFLDLPYTPGYIRRLVGLENYLMCYMTDAIWVGRQTNYGDALPVAFDIRLETGGVGLVGDRAVLPFLGGHFFVGDDNIYFLGPNLQLETIGDPIKDMFFSDPDALWSVRIEADPLNTRILFTQPSVSGDFSRIFSFDYRAKAWSYEENLGNFLGRSEVSRALMYDSWLTGAPYTYDTGLGIFPTYDSMGDVDTPKVFVGLSDYLRYYGEPTIIQDATPSGAITTTIESGDFDYGSLDSERVHLRISLKLKDAITENLTFQVYYSTDEGKTWTQSRGRDLIIEATEKENYVNFRARGSTFRFKLVSSSVCRSFTVKEIVIRAAGAGVEGHLPSNR